MAGPAVSRPAPSQEERARFITERIRLRHLDPRPRCDALRYDRRVAANCFDFLAAVLALTSQGAALRIDGDDRALIVTDAPEHVSRIRSVMRAMDTPLADGGTHVERARDARVAADILRELRDTFRSEVATALDAPTQLIFMRGPADPIRQIRYFFENRRKTLDTRENCRRRMRSSPAQLGERLARLESSETLTLNLVDVPEADALFALGMALQQSFVIYGNSQEGITLVSNGPVSLAEAYGALASALEPRSIAIVEGPNGLTAFCSYREEPLQPETRPERPPGLPLVDTTRLQVLGTITSSDPTRSFAFVRLPGYNQVEVVRTGETLDEERITQIDAQGITVEREPRRELKVWKRRDD